MSSNSWSNSLFGDYATQGYKQDISKLKSEWQLVQSKLTRWEQDLMNSCKSWWSYLDIILAQTEYKDDSELKAERQEILSTLEDLKSNLGKSKIKQSLNEPDLSIFSSDDEYENSLTNKYDQDLFKPELDFCELNMLIEDQDSISDP
jgi:hypothetical protein